MRFSRIARAAMAGTLAVAIAAGSAVSAGAWYPKCATFYDNSVTGDYSGTNMQVSYKDGIENYSTAPFATTGYMGVNYTSYYPQVRTIVRSNNSGGYIPHITALGFDKESKYYDMANQEKAILAVLEFNSNNSKELDGGFYNINPIDFLYGHSYTENSNSGFRIYGIDAGMFIKADRKDYTGNTNRGSQPIRVVSNEEFWDDVKVNPAKIKNLGNGNSEVTFTVDVINAIYPDLKFVAYDCINDNAVTCKTSFGDLITGSGIAKEGDYGHIYNWNGTSLITGHNGVGGTLSWDELIGGSGIVYHPDTYDNITKDSFFQWQDKKNYPEWKTTYTFTTTISNADLKDGGVPEVYLSAFSGTTMKSDLTDQTHKKFVIYPEADMLFCQTYKASSVVYKNNVATDVYKMEQTVRIPQLNNSFDYNRYNIYAIDDKGYKWTLDTSADIITQGQRFYHLVFDFKSLGSNYKNAYNVYNGYTKGHTMQVIVEDNTTGNVLYYSQYWDMTRM